MAGFTTILFPSFWSFIMFVRFSCRDLATVTNNSKKWSFIRTIPLLGSSSEDVKTPLEHCTCINKKTLQYIINNNSSLQVNCNSELYH
jgi:hypothetical protein